MSSTRNPPISRFIFKDEPIKSGFACEGEPSGWRSNHGWISSTPKNPFWVLWRITQIWFFFIWFAFQGQPRNRRTQVSGLAFNLGSSAKANLAAGDPAMAGSPTLEESFQGTSAKTEEPKRFFNFFFGASLISTVQQF
ncbi:hypothetical protein ACOSQ4_027146 [Xanthoceras sorbifolium]